MNQEETFPNIQQVQYKESSKQKVCLTNSLNNDDTQRVRKGYYDVGGSINVQPDLRSHEGSYVEQTSDESAGFGGGIQIDRKRE